MSKIGTPEFMAPEVISEKGGVEVRYDEAIDIW